ncbi:MAG: AsmA family protein [Sedimenticola sp.]
MGKLFKILGALLGVLVLLVAVAVVVLPMVIDPNDYKDEIVSKVQEQTGRTLRIDGDLKLSVFPWLGIEIGGMELSNAEGFGDKAFAAVKHAAVRVKLMPLLSNQLEVDTIGLDGLALNLAKAKDGRTNWDDLAKGGDKERHEEEHHDGGEGLAGLAIGGVDISNAQVSWDDRSTGQHFEIEQFNLKSGSIVPGRPVGLEMSMALQSREPQVKATVNLEGTVSVDEDKGQLDVSGLKVVVDAEGEMLSGGALHAELAAAISMALNGQTLSVRDLDLNAGGLSLSGNLNGSNLNATPAFSGSLALAEFNPRSWMESQKMELPEMSDATAMTRLAASFDLKAEGQTTHVENLKLVLDETNITGSASLRGEAVGFNLNVDDINADRYLPPPAEAESQAESTATGDEQLLPVETLRGLNINGVVKVGKLIINKLLAEQIELTVKASNGKLNIGKKIGRFYDGTLDGSVDINVSGKQPVMRINESLQGLQAGPLLLALTGQDKLAGKGRFNAKLNTQGNSVNAIKRTLGGNMDFRFEDGAVKGFNLAQTIRETKAKFQGKEIPKNDQPAQTDFSELSGSAVISKGVLTNKDLLAKSPYLRVNGAGTVSLVPETLDYKVKAVVVSTAKGQGGEGLEELEGVPVPVHLTGPYASPDFSVDWGSVLTGTQKAKVEKKVEKKKTEVKKKLEDKLGDKLKGLF